MKHDYIEITAFFERAGYSMHKPRQDCGYLESAIKDGLGFVVYPNDEFRFCWQMRQDEPLLDDKLPEIRRLYPMAETKQGIKNNEWTRLFVPLDQSRPLPDALDILKKTGHILGYCDN